jgi:hypothetical protein
VQLEEGLVKTLETAQGNYSYFFAVVEEGKNVDLAVMPLHGDSDVYADLTDEKEASFPFPDKKKHSYKSASPVVLETIHIASGDIKLHGNLLKVSVFCLSTSCGFAVYFDQGRHPLIGDNRPFQGSAVRQKFSYFRYYRNQTDSFSVILTVIGSSNPALYVAYDKEPNKEDYGWFSDTFAGETLEIPEGLIGLYYVGVYCENNCEFSVTVLTKPDEFLPLFPGLPQYITTGNRARSLFYFWNYDKNSLEIKVNVLVGKVVILANPQIPDIEEMHDKIPDNQDRAWASMSKENTDTSITIDENDEDLCYDCNIIISVGSSAGSRYIITVINKSYLEVINNGVPVHGLLKEGELDSFMFKLDSKSDLEIILNVLSGDADLYVATSIPVSESIYDWRTNSENAVEKIMITRDDPRWKVGTYYLAVRGWAKTKYSLIVLSKNSPIYLDLGVARRYNIAQPLYFVLGQAAHVSYTCTITELRGNSYPKVFINYEYNGKNLPSASSHDFYIEGHLKLFGSSSFTLESDVSRQAVIALTSMSLIQDSEVAFTCVDSFTVMKMGQNDYVFYKITNKTTEFEIEVSTTHDIRVTVFFCEGLITAEMSKDRTYPYIPDILHYSNSYKEEFYITKTASKYFLKITSFENNSVEIFTETVTGDLFSMQPGGRIRSKKTENGFKISWPMVFINGKVNNKDASYFLFYGAKLNSMILNYCSLVRQFDEGKVEVVEVRKENSNELQLKAGTYITVAAVFDRHRYQSQGVTVYDPIELVSSKSSSSSDKSIWIYILFIILLIVVLVGFFKFKRNQTNFRRSQGYELSNF